MSEGFPTPSLDDWRAQVERDLRGRSAETLAWTLPELDAPGLEIPTLVTAADLAALPHVGTPVVPPGGGRARTLAPVRSVSVADAADAVSAEAANGVDAVALLFDVHETLAVPRHGPSHYGDGVPVRTADDLAAVLEHVDLTATHVRLEAGASSLAALSLLLTVAERRGVAAGALEGGLDLDPVHGPGGVRGFVDAGGGDALAYVAERCPRFRPLTVEAHAYHGAGAGPATELAFAMAAAAEYLDRFGAERAAAATAFSFSVSPEVLTEIAKLRAARILWRQLLGAYGVDPDAAPMRLHARASHRHTTTYDEHTNLLRSTLACFAASVAGADFVEVDSFRPDALDPPGAFERRLARNQMHVLRDESALDRVADPAAGSYAVELLTHRLASAAWERLQRIDDEGGFAKLLANPEWTSGALDRAGRARRARLDRRKAVVVGVTRYADPSGDKPVPSAVDLDEPDLLEAASEQNTAEFVLPANPRPGLAAAVERAAAGADVAELRDLLPPCVEEEPRPGDRGGFRGERDAERYELLRLGTQEYRYREDHWPTVLLLPLGPVPMRRARAEFAADLLRVIGLRVEDPQGYDDVAAAAADVREQTPDLVVVCSDDASYTELVPAVAEALAGLDAVPLLYVAGPPEACAAHDGVAGFFHRKQPLFDTLADVQDRLGIDR